MMPTVHGKTFSGWLLNASSTGRMSPCDWTERRHQIDRQTAWLKNPNADASAEITKEMFLELELSHDMSFPSLLPPPQYSSEARTNSNLTHWDFMGLGAKVTSGNVSRLLLFLCCRLRVDDYWVWGGDQACVLTQTELTFWSASRRQCANCCDVGRSTKISWEKRSWCLRASASTTKREETDDTGMPRGRLVRMPSWIWQQMSDCWRKSHNHLIRSLTKSPMNFYRQVQTRSQDKLLSNVEKRNSSVKSSSWDLCAEVL